MTVLPLVLAVLAAVTLIVVVLDGKVVPQPAEGRAPDRATWWLLLIIAVAGAAESASVAQDSRAWQALSGAALAVALTRAVVMAIRTRSTMAPALGAWIAVAVAGWWFVSNALQNHEHMGNAVLMRVIAVAFWVGFALYAKTAGVSLRMVAKASVILICLVALAAGMWPDPWRACDQFKCGLYGALLRGPFSSENMLAQLAGVSLLLLLAVRRAPWRGPAFLLCILMLSATSSRTSIAALGCAIVFWGLAAPRLLGRSERMLRMFYASAVLAVHCVSAYLVLTASQTTFSNRGRIWTRAMEVLDGFTLAGVGLDRWQVLQNNGTLPPLFPHNQLLFTYFSGGAVAVVLGLALLLTPLRGKVAGSAGGRFAMAYGVYLSVLGIAEVYWNPLAIDIHVAVLTPFFVLAMRTPSAPLAHISSAAPSLGHEGRARGALSVDRPVAASRG